MKKSAVFLLLLLGTNSLWAMVALTDRVTVIFSKPGVRLEAVPPAWRERWRKALNARELKIGSDERGIPWLVMVARPLERPSRIATSLDLRNWFTEEACIASWDAFHRCMNEKRNPADERLYRKIEREFVSVVACGNEGEQCSDPDFALWRLRWPAPAFMQLDADIGDGGFRSPEAAKKSLHAINALLKKTLYGARFPEDFGEGRSEREVFSLDTVRVGNLDFEKAVTRLLGGLRESGFLKGLSDRDIGAIGRKAKGGRAIYYLPSRCANDQAEGWLAVSNASRVRFDGSGCPRLEILR